MAQQQLFELLKRDHRQVEQFIDQLVEGDEDQRQELFDQLNESLSLHMQLEEKFFYPRIKNAPQLKEQVQDALEEHRETKEFLQKLSKMKIDSEQWLDTLEEMQEGVLHHVEDEEDQIFPQCRDVLNTAQISEIATQIAEAKESGGVPPKTPRRTTGKQTGKQART